MIKKIAFISLGAFPDAMSGTEIQLQGIANELTNDPHFDVTIITSKKKNTKPIKTRGDLSYISDIDLSKNIFSFLLFPVRVFCSLLRADADIYIASAAGAETGIVGIFCKLLGKKYIFRTASSIDCTMEKAKLLGPIIGRLYLFGLHHANIVVTQSETDKENLKKYHGVNAIIIKNAISIRNDKLDISKKSGVLWVGSCRKLKRPEILIDLAKKIPKTKFTMIMPMANDVKYWNIVRRKANSVNNISFIDGVPQKEIQKYFNSARIFVGTSTYEGFPNVYLQACLGGTPIISLNVNPDNFITDNKLGIVAGNSIIKMVKTIEIMISSKKQWKKMSDNALRYVKENHDIKKVICQWKKLL